MAAWRTAEAISTERVNQVAGQFGQVKLEQYKPQEREVVKVPDFSDPTAVVTFYIGTADDKKFIVHKEFACRYSPVLKAAFNSPFIEGQTQTYRLEDANEEAFRFFVQ